MSKPSIVFRPLTENEANVVRRLLEAYGIPVSVSSGLPPAVYPMNIRESTLSVPEEFRDEAIGIIEAHRAAPPLKIRPRTGSEQDAPDE